MDEDRKYMLNEHLSNIYDISDKDYQRRTWIGGEQPGYDFDEAVCHFFDDGDPILDEYKEYGITEYQYQILKKFRDHFSNFADDNNWPAEFIDTPEWTEITEMAKEVLGAFDYQK